MREFLRSFFGMTLMAFLVFVPFFYLIMIVLGRFGFGGSFLSNGKPYFLMISIAIIALNAVIYFFVFKRPGKLTESKYEFVCGRCGHREGAPDDIRKEDVSRYRCFRCRDMVFLAKVPVKKACATS